jgi:Type IV secretion-system coupling protein DNA-binding domain
VSPRPATSWLTVHWPHPLELDQVVGLLRVWAADQRSPTLILETVAEDGHVSFRLGIPRNQRGAVRSQLQHAVPGVHLSKTSARSPINLAGRVHTSTRHRPLRTSEVEIVARTALSALVAARRNERLVLQIVLGPRRIPMAVPTNSPSSVARPWWETLWHGNGATLDGEKRTALREKVADHGFACTIRIGAAAATRDRERGLLLNLLAALRTAETGGIRLRLRHERSRQLNESRSPWIWRLRLNVQEILCMTAWPVGSEDLPGIPAKHPRLLRALPSVKAHDRVLLDSNAPGDERPLGLSAKDALHHTHLIGVTGAGKSTLILNAIIADLEAGRGLVVIDPKGDLVADVLGRVPDKRCEDIVVLDPYEPVVVGMNPLSPLSNDAQLAADGVLAVFKGLYPDAWGPRTQDVLHAALLTLGRRPDSSLIMLPLLLTNDGFRRSITSTINDPVALGPFWSWFDSLSESSRQQAIAPVLSRLRALVMRPTLRAVLGQVQPRFDMQQVFTERKVLLVSLAKGLLGPDASSLLGSLIVARLWQTILTRAAIPQSKRHPVMIYIDEVQDYLHLDTDIADVFAQSRSYGAAFTVAHQAFSQLPAHVRSGIMANARSRVVFNISDEDARTLARGIPELAPEDFTALGRYEVYASLLADGQKTPYASGRTLPPPPISSNQRALRRLSQTRFGQPLDEIEAGFAALLNPPLEGEPPLGRRPRRSA